MSRESIVCDTPDAIEHFRLSSIKAQLKMEKMGLKSSGGPLRPRLAAQLGLSPRAKHDKYIEVVQAKMDALVAKAAQESAVGQTVQ